MAVKTFDEIEPITETPEAKGFDEIEPRVQQPRFGLSMEQPEGSIEEQVKQEFLVAADRGVSLGEAEALVREKGFRQSVIDALKTGTVRAAAAVANLPEHLMRVAERLGEKTREAPYSARAGMRGFAPVSFVGYFGIENEEQEKQFLQTVSVKNPDSPMSKILDHSTRWAENGLKKVLERHPEWQNERADSFMDLLSSPTKLASTIGESIPMLVGAGVLTGTGHPYAAFSMVYAIEGQEAYDEAISSGATVEQAEEAKVIYGTVAAAIEMAQLHQGITIAKGAWNGIRNRMAKQAVDAGIRKGGASFTKQFLTTLAEENAEEWLQGTWQEKTAKMVYGKEQEGGLGGFVDRRLQESLVITALTATTAGAGGAIGAATKKAGVAPTAAAKPPVAPPEAITPTEGAIPAPAAEAKQPWEMTREENWQEILALKGKEIAPGKARTRDAYDKQHERIVRAAVSDGENVPREVLEEYKSEPWAKEALAKQPSLTAQAIEKMIGKEKPPAVEAKDFPQMTREEWRQAFTGKVLSEDKVHSLMRERLDPNEYQMYIEDRLAAQDPDNPNPEAALRAFDLEWKILKQEYGYQYNERDNVWEKLPAVANRILDTYGKITYKEYSKLQETKVGEVPQEPPIAEKPPEITPELEQTNKELLEWSETAKKLRKEEVEPAVVALRKRQVGRATGILREQLRKGLPAWDSLERSIGGYKDKAAIPDVEPPKLTPEQWETYARKILEVYPETDAGVQFQRTETQQALKQLRNGKIPTNREFQLLEKILGRQTTEQIAENLASLRKLTAWDYPKFIIQMFKSPFTLDVQFARQASSFAARHPVQYGKGVKTALKAYTSEQFANEVLDAVEANPNHDDAVEHGLNFLSKAIYSAHRPEQFALGFQEKVALVGEKARPVIKKITAPFRGYGRLMLASERSMVASCNQFLQTMWDKQLEIWSHDNKLTPEKLESLKSEYAKTLNTFIKLLRTQNPSGRKLQEAANLILFSPSMTFSRPLRIKALIANAGSRGYVAQLIATEIGKIMLISWIAALIGNYFRHKNPDEEPAIDSEINPLMSDWGKIKVMDTHFDFMGGDAQFYRTLGRAAVATYVELNQEITGEQAPTKIGEWRVRPLGEILLTYGQTRETAAIGFARDLWTGTDFFGNPLNRAEIAIRGITPEIADATYDALRANGVLTALAAAAATAFSAGVQTYEQSAYGKRMNERNRLAQAYFEQDWDDLTPKEQAELTPQLEELDLAVAQERKERPLVEKFPTTEEVETGKRIYQGMPKEIQTELFETGVTGISLDRRRGDFYLNDRRYRRYEELAISLMQDKLDKLFGSSSYHRLRNMTDKKKKITAVLKDVREQAYKQLEKEINSGRI